MRPSRSLLTTLAASVLGLALALSLAPAATAAAYRPGYDQRATDVASAIGCTKQRLRSGPSTFTRSALVCDLKGRRVNVITFRGRAQEREWRRMVPYALAPGTRGFYGHRKGVVVVAKSFGRKPARVGARAVGGTVSSARSAF